MRFLREHRFALLFLGLLVLCSVMVIRQLQVRQGRHVELREAFILLHTRGYTNQANRLYTRLLRELPTLSNKFLLDDFQRTLLLVDPGAHQPENLIWKYHWTVSNELERRSESSLVKALKLAEEE
jgi:hypothetical protein